MATLWALRLSRRVQTVLGVAILIAAIAALDSHTANYIPLAFLYLLPMAFAGSRLRPWEIGVAAVVCTVLTERFDYFPWDMNFGVPRDILYFAAFAGLGYLMYEAMRRRNLTTEHMRELQGEMAARRDAEEQLEVLVGSSPAAILTADRDARILLANEAAHRLFAVAPEELHGQPLRRFLPSLIHVPAREARLQAFRTTMQCQGCRADGEVFQADVWFSTYLTSAGPRLAAMVFDTSEDLRTREESNLHQLLAGSRILISAVAHEIRNVCGAIAMVHEKLARGGQLAGNKDFETLGTLILALERIAAKDLRQSSGHIAGIDAGGLLEELRIIVDSMLREQGVETSWRVEPNLPWIWGDRQSLMQVFLNLVKNSERALLSSPEKKLSIEARRDGAGVVVRFTDTGGGVAHPESLFRPFQVEAQATGLGLYLSRAFVRGFHGDLRYEPHPGGSTFTVALASAPRLEGEPEEMETESGKREKRDAGTNSVAARGRSQSLPREPEPAARDRG